jgi:hypothetical protein
MGVERDMTLDNLEVEPTVLEYEHDENEEVTIIVRFDFDAFWYLIQTNPAIAYSM